MEQSDEFLELRRRFINLRSNGALGFLVEYEIVALSVYFIDEDKNLRTAPEPVNKVADWIYNSVKPRTHALVGFSEYGTPVRDYTRGHEASLRALRDGLGKLRIEVARLVAAERAAQPLQQRLF